MRTTQQYSITLPLEMAELVERKIKSGGYASVSELLREGVRALMERDAALEHWLREEVTQAVAEHRAAPEQAVPARDIMQRIRARAAARKEDAGNA